MRFAIKTSPQHTTWADMLAVWQAADDIDLFESAWTFDHFYPIFSDSTGPCLEGWVTTTALAQATTAVPRRRARHRQPLPAPGGAGEHGRHPRRHLRRAPRAGAGRGLERGGERRLRHRPAAPQGAVRPLRRGPRGDHEPADATRCRASTACTTSSETPAASPSRVQQPHPPICIGGTGPNRTLRSVARWAQHWNHPGGSPEQLAAAIDVLHQRCAEIGRDPAEILISTHLLVDPADPRRRRGAGGARRPRPASSSASST